MVYPWQQKQWQQLMERKDRLPHALLLLGIRGIGKADFAENFVRALLCQSSAYSKNCDCHSCRLIIGKTHPNLLVVEPEKSVIKIDQVREVSEFINQTSLQGEYRFVVIQKAGCMNINAANALLKTLEEPSPGAMLILICEQASHLPATIVSRCQHFHFPRPESELAMQWLRQKIPGMSELTLHLANGAPLLALQFMHDDLLSVRLNVLQNIFALFQKQIDPLKAASNIEEVDTNFLLDIMLSIITDLLKLRVTGSNQHLANQDFLQQLELLFKQIFPEKMLPYLNFLLSLRSQQQKGINLNKQLMIENMLIRFQECA